MQELTSLHTKRLMVNFETDEQQQEREIEAKTSEITDIFHHSEGLLKQFSKLANDPKLQPAETKVRKNMQSNMAKKVQNLSMQFRATQKVSISVLSLCKLFLTGVAHSNIWVD